ncbi:MAG: DoxX family protein [Polyangia bacterium]
MGRKSQYADGLSVSGYPAHRVGTAPCTVVYCIPRTAIIGAVLLTGYLGGAVEANVQAGNPLPSHTLFPIYFAVLIWGGLALRHRRVWSVLARRSP